MMRVAEFACISSQKLRGRIRDGKLVSDSVKFLIDKGYDMEMFLL